MAFISLLVVSRWLQEDLIDSNVYSISYIYILFFVYVYGIVGPFTGSSTPV